MAAYCHCAPLPSQAAPRHCCVDHILTKHTIASCTKEGGAAAVCCGAAKDARDGEGSSLPRPHVKETAPCRATNSRDDSVAPSLGSSSAKITAPDARRPTSHQSHENLCGGTLAAARRSSSERYALLLLAFAEAASRRPGDVAVTLQWITRTAEHFSPRQVPVVCSSAPSLCGSS